MSWSSWTGFWGGPSYLQGYEQQAKQSTRYLARGTSITTCNTDLSQYDTDLTVGTNVVYEDSTTRLNRGAPRTLVFSTVCSNTTTGALYRHGTASNTETLGLSAANTLRIVVNNTIVLAQTLTVLTGTNDDVVFAWVQEQNPDTSGSSDAVVSHLLVWNVTAGTFERYRVTHAAKTLQSGTRCYFGATDSAGTSAFSGTIEGVLFENRCMSASEIYADWVADLSPVTSDLDAPARGLPATEDTIDALNNWHGPSAAHAVDQTRRLHRAALSPLVNARYSPATAVSQSNLDSSVLAIPLTDGYRGLLSWTHAVALPDNCNLAWVRLHYRTFVTASTAVQVGVRVYSYDRMPGSQLGFAAGPTNSPEVYWVSQTLAAASNQSSPGTYRTLGLLRLARGQSGIAKNKTYLVVGVLVDPASTSTNDANCRFQLNAIQIVPCYRQLDNGIAISGELGSG